MNEDEQRIQQWYNDMEEEGPRNRYILWVMEESLRYQKAHMTTTRNSHEQDIEQAECNEQCAEDQSWDDGWEEDYTEVRNESL